MVERSLAGLVFVDDNDVEAVVRGAQREETGGGDLRTVRQIQNIGGAGKAGAL